MRPGHIRFCSLAATTALATVTLAACSSGGNSTQQRLARPDRRRHLAVADRRLLDRRPGLRARLPAMGQLRQHARRTAGRAQGQAGHPERRQQPDHGHHQLHQADQLGSRQPGVRAVLHAAHGPVGQGGVPLRDGDDRGRGRRARGLPAAPAQRLRPQPHDRQPARAVRALGGVAAAEPAAEDGRLPDGERPVRRPDGDDRAAHPAEGRDQDRVLEGLPGREPRLPGRRGRRGGDRGADGRAGLGGRADRVGVHDRVRAAALQPDDHGRLVRPGPGRRLPEGGRDEQRQRDLRAERLVRRARRTR